MSGAVDRILEEHSHNTLHHWLRITLQMLVCFALVVVIIHVFFAGVFARHCECVTLVSGVLHASACFQREDVGLPILERVGKVQPRTLSSLEHDLTFLASFCIVL